MWSKARSMKLINCLIGKCRILYSICLLQTNLKCVVIWPDVAVCGM